MVGAPGQACSVPSPPPAATSGCSGKWATGRRRGQFKMFSLGLAIGTLLQGCAACSVEDPVAIAAAKHDLEEAFALALSLPDCSGASNLESCRNMERLLSGAFDSLQDVVDSHRVAGG